MYNQTFRHNQKAYKIRVYSGKIEYFHNIVFVLKVIRIYLRHTHGTH